MTGEQLNFREDSTIQILNAVNQDLKGGLFSEAIDRLEQILEIDVAYPGASSVLKCANFWRERLEKERTAGDGFEKGERLLAQWRVFQTFVERLADVPERSLFAIKQFVFKAALSSYLSLAGESEPGGDPEILLQIGRCFKGIGNYERAIEYLERANREKRDDARILAELADGYSLVSETKAAKVFFREAFFIDPQGIDLSSLESPLIQRLAARLRAAGHSGASLNEWIAVYGEVWGVFNVKREMKPLELGKLKQSIYRMEKELKGVQEQRDEAWRAGAPVPQGAATASPSPPHGDGIAPELRVPRLINRYFWLIDHYLNSGEQRKRIEEVLERVRELDPMVHIAYTT